MSLPPQQPFLPLTWGMQCITDSSAGFPERYARSTQAFLPLPLYNGQHGIVRTGTQSSSMQAHNDSWRSQTSSYAGYPPSFVSGTSAPSSRSSTWAQQGRDMTAGPAFDNNGARIQEPVVCEWTFLGCNKWCDPGQEWYEHSKSHFKGNEPPQDVYCFFADCPWRRSYSTGRDAWYNRQRHIDSFHRGCRGDFKEYVDRDFARFLLREGIIKDWEYKDLRLSHTVNVARAYATTNRSRNN